MLNDFTTLANLYHIPEYIALQMISDVSSAMVVIFNHLGPTAFKNFRISKKGEAQIGKNVHEVFAEALVTAVIVNNFKIDITKNDFNE
jgi:tetrahydromethanopterin S-methyltransferase subunit H